jgi:hypothetical protein
MNAFDSLKTVRSNLNQQKFYHFNTGVASKVLETQGKFMYSVCLKDGNNNYIEVNKFKSDFSLQIGMELSLDGNNKISKVIKNIIFNPEVIILVI